MKRHAFALTCITLLAACATVDVTNEWKDPTWHGQPASSVLVIGVARSDTMRRLFEDTFSRELGAAGIRATPSYSSIPPGQGGQAQLGELVQSTGSQAVLATRVQRVEDRINVSPGPYVGGFYGWYGGAWASTPEVTETTLVTLETSVWDARSDRLVWTVTTRSVANSDIPKATEALAKTLIPKLKADGVLR
jgi:hypothetical protein